MAVKKDLSVEYLGVKCQNPFFLSSSPVGSNYEMVAKCFETGWGGVMYKTVGIFVADECSPRFDQTNKEAFLGLVSKTWNRFPTNRQKLTLKTCTNS